MPEQTLARARQAPRQRHCYYRALRLIYPGMEAVIPTIIIPTGTGGAGLGSHTATGIVMHARAGATGKQGDDEGEKKGFHYIPPWANGVGAEKGKYHYRALFNAALSSTRHTMSLRKKHGNFLECALPEHRHCHIALLILSSISAETPQENLPNEKTCRFMNIRLERVGAWSIPLNMATENISFIAMVK
jgi:hypothetical protein